MRMCVTWTAAACVKPAHCVREACTFASLHLATCCVWGKQTVWLHMGGAVSVPCACSKCSHLLGGAVCVPCACWKSARLLSGAVSVPCACWKCARLPSARWGCVLCVRGNFAGTCHDVYSGVIQLLLPALQLCEKWEARTAATCACISTLCIRLLHHTWEGRVRTCDPCATRVWRKLAALQSVLYLWDVWVCVWRPLAPLPPVLYPEYVREACSSAARLAPRSTSSLSR